jgi:hypothetical protein
MRPEGTKMKSSTIAISSALLGRQLKQALQVLLPHLNRKSMASRDVQDALFDFLQINIVLSNCEPKFLRLPIPEEVFKTSKSGHSKLPGTVPAKKRNPS